MKLHLFVYTRATGSRLFSSVLFILLLLSGFATKSLSDQAPGGDFSLTNHEGAAFKLEQLRGRNVLLYFGYLNCPDICPMELNTIAQTIRAIGSDQVVGVFVTLDPRRDTLDKIGKYVGFFHPEIIGLTGSEKEIHQVAEQYNIRYQRGDGEGYTVDHAIHIAVLDRAGDFKAISPFGSSVKQLTAVIRGIE